MMKIGLLVLALIVFSIDAKAQTNADSTVSNSAAKKELLTPIPNGTEPFIESIGNDPAGPPETIGAATLVPSGEPVFIESIGNDPAGPSDISGPTTLVPTGEPVIIESIGNDPVDQMPANTKPKQ